MLGRRPLLLLVHGNIHTLEPGSPRASALALDRASGRIVAIGDDAEIRALAGPPTELVDLRGRTVLPGFIDAHTHMLGYAQARLDIGLRGCRSENEVAERVRARAAQTAPGTWLFGRGWDKNTWPGARFPTRASLDVAAPQHAVALYSHDFHSLWANSLALRLAGIDARTPEPPAGYIEHDADGAPTGMLFERAAMGLVEAVATPADDETLLAELRRVLGELRARGITGIHNIEDARSLRLMQRLHATGDLSPRVLLYIPRAALADAVRLGIESGFGDDRLRFAGVKVFMDGALGSQTAAMQDPYEGRPDYRGLLTTSEPEIERIVREAAGGRLGVAIHAIGDRAVHTALNGIEAALRQQARETAMAGAYAPRYRLEHIQLASAEDIARMARLGVVGSVQPFHAVADRYTAERYWGARHRRAYAYNTLRAAGVPLALGSDVPVDTVDPLRILHAAINRSDDAFPEQPPWLPDQALTVAQAIAAYTRGAAYAGGQEAHQGSLAVGKLADLIVLAEDPFTLPAAHLTAMPVVATLVGGELVHGALD